MAGWQDRLDDWPKRQFEVVNMAYLISLRELEESTKLLEPLKTRAAVVFSSIFSAMAFLSGTALRDVQSSSLRSEFLIPAIICFVAFCGCTILILLGGRKHLWLDGKAVRDYYVQGSQDPQVNHLWDEEEVKRDLIDWSAKKIDANISFYVKVRRLFVGQVVLAALTVTFWSLLVAYATARV